MNLQKLREATIKLPNGARVSVAAVALATIALLAQNIHLGEDTRTVAERSAEASRRAQELLSQGQRRLDQAQAFIDSLEKEVNALNARVDAGLATPAEVTKLGELVVKLEAERARIPVPGPPGPPGQKGEPSDVVVVIPSSSSTSTTTATTSRAASTTTTTARPCTLGVLGTCVSR